MTAHGEGRRRAEGATIVLCTGPACCSALHVPLMTALRAIVRASAHGVLVTSGCLLGSLACKVRAFGPLLMVQPCDVDRRPVGCALLVGPLRGDEDVATVGEWLRGARFDPALLPEHLRATHGAVRAAVRN